MNERTESELRYMLENAHAVTISCEKALATGAWEIELEYLSEKTFKLQKSLKQLLVESNL